MDVQLLGLVEASIDGRPVALGAGKRPALLALLALHEGSTVSADRLVDGLWGERPPASAPKMVQAYVSQLRRTLTASGGGARILTRGHGYELRLGAGEVDARRFERLVAAGAAREALALWRGPALDDVAGEPFAAAEIRRLDGLRLAAYEQAVETELAAGQHREVLGELETLVHEDPLRERVHWLRMLALYRSGRQAEALEAYRFARHTLVEEIGVEPGPELRQLHEAILRQDPTLDPPRRPPLPSALDAGTPLAGREADLEWLREQWRPANAGRGRLVVLAGPSGIGKTRLAAELAVEVYRDGGTVLYGSGAGAPDAVLTALASAGSAQRPTLLVLDDVDRAAGAVPAAVAELASQLAARPALVLATAAEPLRLGARATRSLVPLDAAGARVVAERYATGRQHAEIPVERLLEASGGLPRQLHRLASQWARADAETRVGADARRAADERAGWRVAEADLAGSVAELHAVRERAEPEADDRVMACPFKGLASFDVADAPYFFGRERLVAEMVARVAGESVLGVVGPSGSGKSSALRAGLLAELANGVLPGSERWPLRLLRPGQHPLEALEVPVDPRPGRPIIAVDQFEELFTSCRQEGEREAFVAALVAATRHPSGPALVLIAVRADYYGRCAAYPELARALAGNHVLVGPMRRDELRRAVELPARRAGLRVEPELTDALIADIDGEPGALPLLSTALLELWQRQDGRRLCLTAYLQAGGVRGAVARLAERAYERLAPERRPLARGLLLRLAGEGEGTDVVRRRVPLNELEPEDGAIADVLGVLADERLITIGDGVVEVAHEALLHEWPRLGGWLEEDAEGRRLHRQLAAAATEWHESGRDPGPAVSRRAPGRRARMVGRPRRRTQRDRTRVPRRRPDRERPSEPPPADRARRRRVSARAHDDRRRDRAQRTWRRARPGARGRRAAPGRPGAGGGPARPVAAARAPGHRARRLPPDPWQPALSAAQEPGRDRRTRRGRQAAHQPRCQPGWAAALVPRRGRQRDHARPADTPFVEPHVSRPRPRRLVGVARVRRRPV
jgi:DNA-binding SARP family transcriptional activator